MKTIKLLKITIIIAIVVSLVDIIFRLYEFYYLKRIINDNYVASFENKLYLIKIGYYHWVDLSINLLIILLFIFWLYPSYKIIYSEYSDRITYTPKWAILGFFIPIANFFIPYKVVTDIWEQTYNRKNNFSYKNNLVKFWWFSWVITIIYARMLSGYSSKAEYADEILQFNYHYLLIDVIYLFSVIFMLRLINEINSSLNK